MDPVLGLSVTASSVRWVLVERNGGDGATLGRGTRSVDDVDDVDALLSALLDNHRPHAVGLTWAVAADSAASALWQALTDRGVENVIAVSDIEAAEALSLGVADAADCERVVVCVAEPAATVVSAVTTEGVIAERMDPACADMDGLAPDAVFVLGSGDIAAVVAEMEHRTSAPVVSADEADLALARGAALATASTVALLDAQDERRRRLPSPTAALASVLAAAVVTFVVSASAAVGMSLTPDTPAPQLAGSAQEPVPEARPLAPKVVPPGPAGPPPAPATPVANEVQAPPPEAVEIAAPPEAPPVEEAPAADVPEYVPPAPPPDYLPPATGAVLVPPGGPLPAADPPPVTLEGQQPRLRDRIIEHIPIINRFHEPQYGYTP